MVDFKSKFDVNAEAEKRELLNAMLRERIENLLTLSSVNDIDEITANDWAFDITISNYYIGIFGVFNMLNFAVIPLFWRPKITLSSRLYNLKTNKTKREFIVKERMNMKEYIYRGLSFQNVMGLRQAFNEQSVYQLLDKACYRLLLKIQRNF